MDDRERARLIAAAESTADTDCARGLAELDASIPFAVEFSIGDSPSRSRMLHPKRASLIGMRDHLARFWCDSHHQSYPPDSDYMVRRIEWRYL